MVDPLNVYKTINYNGLWSINGPFTGDVVAGVYAALRELNLVLINSVTVDGDRLTPESLSRYIIVSDPDPYTVTLLKTSKPYNYGFWIGREGKYILVSFTTSEFLRGFISICKAFGVDFRDLSFGLPFTMENDGIHFYYIEGYDIDNKLIKQNVDLNLAEEQPIPYENE